MRKITKNNCKYKILIFSSFEHLSSEKSQLGLALVVSGEKLHILTIANATAFFCLMVIASWIYYFLVFGKSH